MIMRKITIGVEGMMCSMCEAHINEAVRAAFPQVKKVTSDRKKKQTVILSDNDLDENAVRKAIDETGYQFTSFTAEEYVKKGLFGF